jgi:hypothetical protein
MTRDDIIRMAREAGGYVSEMPMGDFWLFDDASFERFSALYAALAEPEAYSAMDSNFDAAIEHINESEALSDGQE